MSRSGRKSKFIVYGATGADGFMARRDGSVDWLDRPRPKGNYGMAEFYRSIDTCILGRKTYDLSVSFGMAEGYAGKKNYVFSRTLSKAASPKVTIVSEDVTAFAERLRSEKGKDVWLVGGGEFAYQTHPTTHSHGPRTTKAAGEVRYRLLCFATLLESRTIFPKAQSSA